MKRLIALVMCSIFLTLAGCTVPIEESDTNENFQGEKVETTKIIDVKNVPVYQENPYVEINDNKPYFKKSEYTTKAFETYSKLDKLGRCGVAYANICKEIMPTEERGPIGMVKPVGWHTIKYDCVDGKYLYNRCHLIGFQLAGENANEKNLITGTRYLNVEGMLPFEDEVADYVKQTKNHVLYRVTPIYKKKNLLANGVEMEAYSVEDNGEGVCFNVYVYNVQPGVKIDYKTGDSWESDEEVFMDAEEVDADQQNQATVQEYILNSNTMKFHRENCSSVSEMSEHNKELYKGNRQDLIEKGYEPCKRCNP